MFKSKSFWLKSVAVLALSFPSISLFAGTQQAKPVEAGISLSGLLAGSLVIGVQLPPILDIQAPEVSIEKDGGRNPQPGRDFAPKIDDQVRVKAIMKLIADIYQGSHLPYSQDGATFANKEGRLPAQPRGFYKEYTLIVPGRHTGDGPVPVVIGGKTYMTGAMLSARGPERIIIGGSEKIYYTPNHYTHFAELTVVY